MLLAIIHCILTKVEQYSVCHGLLKQNKNKLYLPLNFSIMNIKFYRSITAILAFIAVTAISCTTNKPSDIAEVGWSPVSARKWDDYRIRLGKQADRFTVMQINYYASKLVPWTSSR
jgi:hypothetical protein